MTSATIRTGYVTRIEHFSAAHRLNSIHLSPTENQVLFGKFEVTIKGQINPQSGMVINITDLKKTLQIAVMEPCDHRNLDVDVPFFHSQPSTTENLAVFLWENIKQHLPLSKTYELHEIKLYETDKNVVTYRGE
ncbi:hypothetical protein BGZ65_000712 [Modicella reniformis]|uniref:6-pyruvoyltetrahydropterin synthase n=1 Tax=Modicella reniformis TaxID=1440133 RepID=A0A9P6J6U3_9FUNG|nr:hypothetical protein BGZ65_000712 [Modicella reniformis]